MSSDDCRWYKNSGFKRVLHTLIGPVWVFWNSILQAKISSSEEQTGDFCIRTSWRKGNKISSCQDSEVGQQSKNKSHKLTFKSKLSIAFGWFVFFVKSVINSQIIFTPPWTQTVCNSCWRFELTAVFLAPGQQPPHPPPTVAIKHL